MGTRRGMLGSGSAAVGKERAAARRLDVVCFPDMEWDYALWTNRQHMMYRLPKVDSPVRVLYVAPPRFALSGRLGHQSRLRRRCLPEGQRSDGLWTQRIGDRLWVLQPLLPVPNRLL